MFSFTAYGQARKNGRFKCHEKSLNDKNLKYLGKRLNNNYVSHRLRR
jgi:hypothetical protein